MDQLQYPLPVNKLDRLFVYPSITRNNTSNKVLSNRAMLLIALFALILSGNAYAGDATRHYKIPAQSLNNALMRFAAESNLELVFTADKVRGLTANSLDGTMTAAQALTQLLQGSGMTYRYINAHSVTLEQQPGNFSKTATTPDTPEPQSDSGEGQMMPKVTVEADADNPYDDPTWQTDPYNTDYVLPKATAGTKTNTPVMETPLNVQVISKQVLKDQQVIRLDQALRNVSGVTTQRKPLGSSNLILRGFQSQTLFRNGFRMDSNEEVFGNSQQFANVESVEVLKGPAAILYGRVEPGGMVNIVTKQPRSTPYYALNQQFGSYDLYRTSIDATGPLTKDDTLLYRVNASFQSNNSFRDLVHGEDVFFAPILKWNISPRTQATLEMEYNRSLSNVDSQLLPFKNNQFINLPHYKNLGERNPLETENIFVGFNWSHQFNDDWSIKHQVAFKRRDDNLGLSAIPTYIITDKVNRDVYRRGSYTTDTIATNLDLTGHFKTWGLEHTLLFGGDYYRFDIDQDQTFADSSTVSLNNIDHSGNGFSVVSPVRGLFKQNTDNYGLYLQDQIKLPYNVHVMGGLRYQYIRSTRAFGDDGGFKPPETPPQINDAVTPRVGLLWQPQKWLSLYSNYAENFGANTGLFAFAGNGLPAGKPLPPTSAQQWEIGVKTEFFDGRLRATLAYYDLTKQNVPTTDPDATHLCGFGRCSIAVGEVRSRGPELDIQGEILPGWNVIATYANQDVRVTKSKDTLDTNNDFLVGNRLQFVPRNVGSVWTTYEVQQGDLKGFKIGGGVNLQDGVVNADNTFKSPGYALVGLMTGYSFEVGKSKITAQLNVENLLDKTYFTNASPIKFTDSGSVNFSTPRTFMGSINVEY
jgi:iron complex outermembrane recepter protein